MGRFSFLESTITNIVTGERETGRGGILELPEPEPGCPHQVDFFGERGMPVGGMRVSSMGGEMVLITDVCPIALAGSLEAICRDFGGQIVSDETGTGFLFSLSEDK